MRHPQSPPGFSGTLSELAEQAGDLRYDALRDLLALLAAKVERDADKDATRGRQQLAAALRRTANGLAQAADASGEAWRISEPFMREC